MELIDADALMEFITQQPDGRRVLPKEYLYFASRGDGRNYFRTEYVGGVFWEGVCGSD